MTSTYLLKKIRETFFWMAQPTTPRGREAPDIKEK